MVEISSNGTVEYSVFVEDNASPFAFLSGNEE